MTTKREREKMRGSVDASPKGVILWLCYVRKMMKRVGEVNHDLCKKLVKRKYKSGWLLVQGMASSFPMVKQANGYGLG